MAKKTAQSVTAPESTPIATSSMPVRRWQENESAGETNEQAAGLMFANTNEGAMMDNVTRSLETAPPSPPSLEIPLQTKLTLGEVGDRYEQEADRVASETVNILHRKIESSGVGDDDPNHGGSGNHFIQRSSQVQTFRQIHTLIQRDEEGTVSNEIESSINSMRGTGSALPRRDRFEQAMGANFGNVRVHQNSQSDQLNRQLSSRAFTTGTDIFFKQGELTPGTQKGDALLAHELTHVKQQNPTLNLKPVEETTAPRVSRATEGVIQRGTNVNKLREVVKAARTGIGWVSKNSATINLVEELLIGFNKNQSSPFRYFYIQKAYRLLVYKKTKHSGKLETEIEDYMNNTLKPLAERERDIYELWNQEQGSNEEEQSQAKTHHAKIKELLAKHNEAIPDEDLDKRYSEFVGSSIGKTGVGRVTNKFKQNKKSGHGFTIDKVKLEDAPKIVKDFRKDTNKGWFRQRGEIFSNVEHLLVKATKHYKKAKTAEDEEKRSEGQRVVACLNMATHMLDLWLLKYGKERHQAGTEDEQEDANKTYNQALKFRKSFADMAVKYAKNLMNLDDPVAATKVKLPEIGGGATDEGADSDVMAQLNYEHVLKKYGTKYSGDCGYFFGTLYPLILNQLAPNVGMKSKFEADVLIQVPGPCPPLGFHMKIDVERKDQNEMKNWTDVEFTTGIDWGTGKVSVGLGMYFEFTANTAQKIGKLFSFSMYRRFRESRFAPAWFTNLLWGGSGGKQGRFEAEAWAQGVEENIFGDAGKPGQKAYAEAGFLVRGAAQQDVATDIAGKVDVIAGLGKRYSQETLAATGSLVPVNKSGEVVFYPSDPAEYNYIGIGADSVKDAIAKSAKAPETPVHDTKWKHPFLKYVEGIEKERELTSQEKAIKKSIKDKYSIVKFIAGHEYHGKKKGLIWGTGPEKQKGFDTGRYEVNGRMQIGPFAGGAKLKWEVVGGTGDKGVLGKKDLKPERKLRKMEIEVKFKVLGSLGHVATNIMAGITGAQVIVDKAVSTFADKSNKKSKEQEKKDKGQASRVFGDFMTTVATGATALGYYFNEGVGKNIIQGVDMVVETGAQLRFKFAKEAKNLLQQTKNDTIDKVKGESHLEVVAGLGLGSTSTITQAGGVEIAKRLISLKWEGGKKWKDTVLARFSEESKAKRREILFGAYDQKRENDKTDPFVKSNRAIKSEFMLAAKTLLERIQVGWVSSDAFKSSDDTPAKHQLWAASLATQAQRFDELPGLEGLPGKDWKEAFKDAFAGYARLYKSSPEKYFQDDLVPDQSLFVDVMETGIGQFGWGKFYADLCSDKTVTPNAALYYKGKTDEESGYKEKSAKFEVDSICSKMYNFYVVLRKYDPLISGVSIDVESPIKNNGLEDDKSGNDSHDREIEDKIGQEDLNLIKKPKVVNEISVPPSDPMIEIDLEPYYRIARHDYTEANNLFGDILSMAMLIPNLAAAESEIKSAGGNYGVSIYNTSSLLSSEKLVSDNDVRNRIAKGKLFSTAIVDTNVTLKTFYAKVQSSDDSLVLKDFARAGTEMDKLLATLKESIAEVEKQVQQQRKQMIKQLADKAVKSKPFKPAKKGKGNASKLLAKLKKQKRL